MAQPAAQPQPARGVVLVVEDDIDNREALAEYLRSVNFVVHSAENGFDGFDAATRLRPGVILMDLKLRGLDGWEVTRRLGLDERTRDIPVIAVSACVFPQDVGRALDAGCVRFVSKPFNLPDLVKAIDDTLVRPKPRRATSVTKVSLGPDYGSVPVT